MANNNLKFDLGSTVRQVAELNQALQALGQVAQTLFSNLGSLTDAFGSKVTNAAQNVNQATGGSGMMTQTGQQQAANVIRDRFMNKIIRSDLESGGGKYMVSDGNVMERMVTAGGTIWRGTGRTAEGVFRNETAEGAMASAIARSSTPAAPSTPSFNPTQTGSIRNAPGYNIADVPRLVASQGGIGGISDSLAKSIESLNKTNNESNRNLASVLDKIRSDLNANNEKFTQVFQEYSSKSALDPSSDEYKEYMSRLTNAMKSLEDSIDAAKEGSRNAPPPPGGGGGGFTDMINRWGGVAGAVGGLAVGGAQAYYSVSAAYQNALHGRQLEQAQLYGQFTQAGYGQMKRMMDVNSAEGLLLSKGDKLLPGEFLFQGVSGRNRALELGRGMNEESREIQRLERERGFWGSVGQIGTGAMIGAAGVAGLVPSGGASTAMAAGGMHQVMSGVTGILTNDITSPYTLREGGGALTNYVGGRLVKGYSEKAAWAQRAELTRDFVDQQSRAQEFSEAELKARQPLVDAMQGLLDAQSARREAARLIGGHRTRRLTEYSGAYFDLGRANRMEANAADVYEDITTGFGDSFDTSLIPGSRQNFGGRRLVKTREQVLKEAEAEREHALGRLPWIGKGMTQAEWIGAHAQTTLGMRGRSATDREVGIMASMELAGLGSISQNAALMGGMGGVAGGGGKDNYNNFMKAMSSAISIGFDDSRMSKQFVQSTAELARSVGTTNIGGMANLIGLTAQIGGKGGRADELSLSQAMSGFQTLAGVTGQTGGFIGAMKLKGAYGMGASFGEGAGILNQSNAVQSWAAWRDLKTKGDSNDIRARSLIEMHGKEKATKLLEENVRSSTTGLVGVYDQQARAGGRSDLNSELTRISGMKKGAAQTKAVNQVIARMTEVASTMGLSPEAGMAFTGMALDMFGGQGISGRGAGYVEKWSQSREQAAIDAGKVSQQKFIANLNATNLGELSRRATKEDYFQSIKDGGWSIRSKDNIMVTEQYYKSLEERAKKGEANAREELKDIDTKISHISNTELVQRAVEAGLYRGEQKVWIQNWFAMENIMSKYMKSGRANPNSGSGSKQ